MLDTGWSIAGNLGGRPKSELGAELLERDRRPELARDDSPRDRLADFSGGLTGIHFAAGY